MTQTLPQIIVVAGPTSSGKSDFAVELALSFSKGLAPYIDGEIISADSRQVYRGLDIGTGKITKEEMKGVPHHMLDVADAREDFSVARYREMALPIIDDILRRGKTPIICGGTGQYIDALMYTGGTPPVKPDKELRQALEKKSEEELYSELLTRDPRRAKTIDRYNKVRLVRALEIVASLGTVPMQEEPHFRYDTVLYLMNPSRTLVRERIKRRLLSRMEHGMLEECKGLITQGVSHTVLERLGLEYRYMSRYLQGNLTYDEFVTQLTHKIFRYAKRQETWNKKYLPFAKLIEIV